MTLPLISAADADKALAAGATLVDIREREEHAQLRIPGARLHPLSALETMPLPAGPIVFHCRTGNRTRTNADRLSAAAAGRNASILDGGLDSWRAAGLPVESDRP